MKVLEARTGSREEIVDLTSAVLELIHASGWENGAVHIFCTHTTCGLTINEGADPDVRRDLLRFFRETAPRNHDWLHAEGNSDAHILSSILGVSLLIPLENGKPLLGAWQHIYLYEGDGPRRRRLYLQLLHS